MNHEDWKNLIVSEVRDTEANILRNNIDTIWKIYEDKNPVRLRYLFAKRHAIEFMMGEYRTKVTFSGMNSSFQIGEIMKNLQMMHELVSQEIIKTEKDNTFNRNTLSGELKSKVPIERPSTNSPDANSRRLRGDAYLPPLRDLL